ncbi:MAG TPA: Crp/Fnr family transcriptional regulator [Acidobacteriaceae bacterium]|nr:Crp/Fnr family transcriptional regulator [Acidobacteriaceae bacterium]
MAAECAPNFFSSAIAQPTFPLSSRRPAIFPRSFVKVSTSSPENACTFSSTILHDFHSIGVSRHREAHAVLIHEGFPADRLLIICSGNVKVTAASADGRLLRVAGPGDILGLSALRPDTLYRVTAETLGPCTIKSIPRADFVRFMETHADVNRATALAIAREYNGALLTARRLALQTSAAGKLASTLLDWARMDDLDDSPAHTNLPISFAMQLTHEELGSMAGLSRETVSRTLLQFRREGLVEQTDDRITLNQPSLLESLYC